MTVDSGVAAEHNRHSWNAAVEAHASHRPGLQHYLRTGGLTVFPEELALLGEMTGRSLLHLFCNTGHESLSFNRLGATVTGVDLSDAAIAYARSLAEATGLQATFVQADVYAYLSAAAHAGLSFDRIYCGYGAICWLRDLATFASGVAAILAPEGRFVLVEFHPTSNMFDPEWRLRYNYPHGGELLTLDGVGDYVGAAGGGLSPGGFAEGVRDFVNPHQCHLYRWGIGEIVSAFAAAGLRIRRLQEFFYVNGEKPFARMRLDDQRRYYPPDDVPKIPLMYGLVAE
ncbi:class I SAM-dependent methyltransferase [Candidatus Chloroploca asiatica]|uniref:class I SAM-dependent methyltransferase n=1 Tax=Candidatus Chloroploca asiatica TaxID=1506545 RepID=UPI001FE9FF53|nr:class I SAM-dependent methyltransferase [Candidatus Chloroploca asiatica]